MLLVCDYYVISMWLVCCYCGISMWELRDGYDSIVITAVVMC